VKVLALIYADEAAWDSLSEEERQATYARYREFGERAGAKVADGAEVAPTRSATTVRVRDGEVLLADGPSEERGEPLGGFYLFDVESLDEAAELAAGIPSAATGAIELRAASPEEAP
jgi:hypothetical protein